MDLDLSGRAYIVSGGSSGLGFASARALVDEGAQVLVVARSADQVDAAVADLGGNARGMSGDLSDPDVAERAVARLRSDFGRVDGCLASVGGPPAGSVLTTTDAQWRSAFETVFLGTVRLTRHVVEGIRSTGGSSAAIALVLSTSAVEVFSGLTTSNGLRPGLAMIVKDLADEVGPEGIRVNGLLPGRIATDRLAALDAATGDAAAARGAASQRIPLRRYGTPDEFGRVAAFVLSPAASYVTGSLLRVDGGVTRSL
jgi:3-oxoacyl-[acyl-carrier protein] reductase